WLCSVLSVVCFFFFSSRRRHTRFSRDWSSDVCSSDLVQRSRQSQMHLLLEGTGVPNWVLLSAQAIALFKLLLTMMVVCMITGISYQLYQGYDQIELPHYLFDLFVLGTLKYAYLIFFALFIHSLFRN